MNIHTSEIFENLHKSEHLDHAGWYAVHDLLKPFSIQYKHVNTVAKRYIDRDNLRMLKTQGKPGPGAYHTNMIGVWQYILRSNHKGDVSPIVDRLVHKLARKSAEEVLAYLY